MIKSLQLIMSLALLVSCSTVEVPDVYTYVTLPASGNGHGISTLSHKQILILKNEWDEKKKRGLIIFSEDWAKLKETILKNCLTNECKQSVGALDTLFFQIDKALNEIVVKPK